MNISEIRTMRQATRAKIEDFLGRTASRELSTEENQLFTDMKAEGERLGSLESRYAVLEAFDVPRSGAQRPLIPTAHRNAKDAIMAGLDQYFRTGKQASDTPLNIQQSPIDSGLAAAVPTTVVPSVLELTGATDIAAALGVREFPRENTAPLVLPLLVEPSAVNTVVESAGLTDSTPPGFDSLTFAGDDYATLTKVSIQSLMNVAFPLVPTVMRGIMLGLITKLNAAFMSAFSTALTGNADCLAGTIVPHDPVSSFSSLFTALHPIWDGPNNMIVLNRTAERWTMNARDTLGRPLLNIQDGTIMGKKYVVSPDVNFVAYGNFNVGAARSLTPVYVKVLLELYAEKGQVGYQARQFADWHFAAESTASKQPVVYLSNTTFDLGS